jgi:hypothetical protein
MSKFHAVTIFLVIKFVKQYLEADLYHPVSTFILGPGIAHGTLPSRTSNLCTSVRVRDSVLTTGKTVSFVYFDVRNGKTDGSEVSASTFFLNKRCCMQNL